MLTFGKWLKHVIVIDVGRDFAGSGGGSLRGTCRFLRRLFATHFVFGMIVSGFGDVIIVAFVLALFENNHILKYNFRAETSGSVLQIPASSFEITFHVHEHSFSESFLADFGELGPSHTFVEFGGATFFTSARGPLTICGKTERYNRLSTGGGFEFGIPR